MLGRVPGHPLRELCKIGVPTFSQSPRSARTPSRRGLFKRIGHGLNEICRRRPTAASHPFNQFDRLSRGTRWRLAATGERGTSVAPWKLLGQSPDTFNTGRSTAATRFPRAAVSADDATGRQMICVGGEGRSTNPSYPQNGAMLTEHHASAVCWYPFGDLLFSCGVLPVRDARGAGTARPTMVAAAFTDGAYRVLASLRSRRAPGITVNDLDRPR